MSENRENRYLNYNNSLEMILVDFSLNPNKNTTLVSNSESNFLETEWECRFHVIESPNAKQKKNDSHFNWMRCETTPYLFAC